MGDSSFSQIKEAFLLFDRNADGYIDASDFSVVLRSLGVCPSQSELDEMLNEAKNGLISFEQFNRVAQKKVNDADLKNLLIKSLKTFDREGRGGISSSELKHVLLNLGERLSEDQVNGLIDLGDPEKTGIINYEEFAAKLCSQA